MLHARIGVDRLTQSPLSVWIVLSNSPEWVAWNWLSYQKNDTHDQIKWMLL